MPFARRRLPPDEAADRRIENVLYSGFNPFRCEVEFQDRGSTVDVTIYGHDGRTYVVAGRTVDALRDPETLARYVRDIRYALQQRGLMFDDLQS